MGDIFKFSIPGKPDYVSMVRIAIASLASNAGFNVEAIDDIKVAVSEACKFVTCHGHEGWSNRYDVVCEIGETQIRIMVNDSTEGHDLYKNTRSCANCPGEGELGIFIIDTLMDEIQISEKTDGCKSINMVKNK